MFEGDSKSQQRIRATERKQMKNEVVCPSMTSDQFPLLAWEGYDQQGKSKTFGNFAYLYLSIYLLYSQFQSDHVRQLFIIQDTLYLKVHDFNT